MIKKIKITKYYIDQISILSIIVSFLLIFFGMTRHSLGDQDVSYYITMAKSFAENRSFTMPAGNIFPNNSPIQPSPSHHYPPLYPLVLSFFIIIFGFSTTIILLGNLFIFILYLITGFFTTKDIFNKSSSLKLTAIQSLLMQRYVVIGGSEILIALFFNLTLWSIYKSIEDEPYIIYAGIFAGLGYLTKNSLGYFFIITGLAGLTWRFYYHGWDTFRSKSYMYAITIFVMIIGTWIMRNLLIFGWPHWQSSIKISYTFTFVFNNFSQFIPVLLLKIPFFLTMFLIICIYFIPELLNSLKPKFSLQEHISFLWVAVILTFIIGIFMASAFKITEYRNLFWLDNFRYLLTITYPIFWLTLLSEKQNEKVMFSGTNRIIITSITLFFGIVFLYFTSSMLFLSVIFGTVCFYVPKFDQRYLIAVLLIFMISFNHSTSTFYTASHFAAEDLNPILEGGEKFGIIGDYNGNRLNGHLHEKVKFFNFNTNSHINFDFIISTEKLNFSEYSLFGNYSHYSKRGFFQSIISFTYSEVGNSKYQEVESTFVFYIYYFSQQSITNP